MWRMCVQEWGPSCPHEFIGGFRLEADMSWTPVDEIVQRDAAISTINAIVGARTTLGTTPAMRLGIPGIPELSNADGPHMANGSCWCLRCQLSIFVVKLLCYIPKCYYFISVQCLSWWEHGGMPFLHFLKGDCHSPTSWQHEGGMLVAVVGCRSLKSYHFVKYAIFRECQLIFSFYRVLY